MNQCEQEDYDDFWDTYGNTIPLDDLPHTVTNAIWKYVINDYQNTEDIFFNKLTNEWQDEYPTIDFDITPFVDKIPQNIKDLLDNEVVFTLTQLVTPVISRKKTTVCKYGHVVLSRY